MSNLNIIRIGNAVEIANSLYITVISILPGADTYQCIPRLYYIAYRLGLLLGFYFGNRRSLSGNLLLRIGIFLGIRVQRFLGLALRLLCTRAICGFLWSRAMCRLSQKLLSGF